MTVNVYHPGPCVVVTSTYVENARGRYQVAELSKLEQVHGLSYPARQVALISGGVELLLAAPLAVAYGAAAAAGLGLVVAGGVTGAVYLDGRRNPRWMVLRAEYRGRVVPLFSSRDKQEFGQVCRAVQRAVEENELVTAAAGWSGRTGSSRARRRRSARTPRGLS